MPTSQDHPLPPTDLNDRNVSIETIDISRTLFRIHQTTNPETSKPYSPIFFGNSSPHRFDAPRQYGVLYVGIDDHVAFLEVFRGDVRSRILYRDDLVAYSMSTLTIHRPISLIRASGSSLERMGANSGIFSTKHRWITQQWSLAFWNQFPQVDGILYPSCHDNERFCVALFSDRINETLTVQSTAEILSDSFKDRLTEITDTYGYTIFP